MLLRENSREYQKDCIFLEAWGPDLCTENVSTSPLLDQSQVQIKSITITKEMPISDVIILGKGPI